MWRVAAIVPSQPRKQRPQQDRRRPGTRAICADDRSRARHPAQPPQPSEGHNAIICATAAQIAERAARAMEACMHQSFFTVKSFINTLVGQRKLYDFCCRFCHFFSAISAINSVVATVPI